jgi:hypothetical protein
MTATTNDFLDAAKRYVALGYQVFPCVPGTKEPLTAHGFYDATMSLEQLEQWWLAQPQANIAVAAFPLLVVDCDAQSNWLAAEPERALSLASAPVSLTPHGGRHHLFRRPRGKTWKNTVGRLAPHVDTRTEGGYILVPPSVVDGVPYRWVPGLELEEPPDQLAEPPEWLVQELDQLADHSSTSARVATGIASGNVIPQGQRNATLSHLGGTMRRVGMDKAEIAAALHQVNAGRCVPPLPPNEVERIAASIAQYEPDQVAVAVAERHWDQMYVTTPPEESNGTYADPGPIPDELLTMPGFVGDVMEHTLRTAPYPERTLAFAGALSLQGFLAGRKVRDVADNRSNLYVLALANSGAGKDHPRKINQQILVAAGVGDCLGDSFASDEGLEDWLYLHPAMLFQTDEIDGLMLKIHQAKDARHESIMNVLLKMYTSANSLYVLRAKAGRAPALIDQPCLCLFGTAIPQHCYEALTPKMLTNGFFARLLILETGKRGHGQAAQAIDVPAEVLETAQWWVDGPPAGNLAGEHPRPQIVPATAAATAVLREFRLRADGEYSRAEAQQDQAAMALWARAAEKASRLALLYACSAAPREPVITPEALRWACAMAEHQTRRMLYMAGLHVHESEFDSKRKRLLDVLAKWRDEHGDAWMPFWRVSRKLPWPGRDHEEVRHALLQQQLLESDVINTRGRPGLVYRLPAAPRKEAA